MNRARWTMVVLGAGVLVVSGCASGLTEGAAVARPPQPNAQIAFALYDQAPDESVIAVVNPDGTHMKMVSPAGVAFGSPHWSPDGTRIAGTAPGSGTLAGRVLNVDTGDLLPIPNPDGMLMDCFVWTSDAQRLACNSFNPADGSHGIYTVPASGGSGRRQITADPVLDDIPGSYSPDGKRLEFARFTEDGPVGLFVINANGTGIKQITPPGALIGGDRFGDWSPQGNEIVFAQHDNADVRNSIWVVHADGTGLHEINFNTPTLAAGPKPPRTRAGASTRHGHPTASRSPSSSTNRMAKAHAFTPPTSTAATSPKSLTKTPRTPTGERTRWARSTDRINWLREFDSQA